jgi:hypothetical protein
MAFVATITVAQIKNMGRSKRWTEEDDLGLLELRAAGKSAAESANLLGRTELHSSAE